MMKARLSPQSECDQTPTPSDSSASPPHVSVHPHSSMSLPPQSSLGLSLPSGLRSGNSSPALRRVGGTPGSAAPSPFPNPSSSRSLPQPLGTWSGSKQSSASGTDSKDHPVAPATHSTKVGLIGWIGLAVIACVLIYVTYRDANGGISTVVDASALRLDMLSPPSSVAVPSSASSAASAASNSVFPYPPSFLFPKPSSRVFVTSTPNRGAGLGHQFGEWIMGPYMAYMGNASYLHTGFLVQSQQWNRFLGFGEGEDIMEDLAYNFHENQIRIVKQDWTGHQRDPSHAVEWMQNTVATIEPTLKEREVMVVHYDVVHTHEHKVACLPALNLKLRQKYCAQRVAHPLHQDFYAADRAQGKIIVAVHYRCGDSCLDYSYRATPFPSTIATIGHIVSALSQVPGGHVSNLAFHFFAQRPKHLPPSQANLTAEEHFKPMLESAELRGLNIVTHFDASPTTTMHHLITSDLLFGSQSSFSWVANLLHHVVAVGPMMTCKWSVPYRRDGGYIDEALLTKYFIESRDRQPKFNTLDDCYALRE
jgi:hypothetical protein